MSAGVSATGSGEILIVADTEAFGKRMAELKSSREQAEKAFTQLRLGKDAAKAYDEAKALKDEYTARMARINEEGDEIRAKAGAIVNDAHAQAGELVAEAKAQAKALLDAAKDEAARLMAEAKEARNEAKKALKEAKDKELLAANKAAAAEAQEALIEKDREELVKSKDKYEKILSRIQKAVEGE